MKLFPRPVSNGVGRLVLDGEAVAVANDELDVLLLLCVVVADLDVEDEETAEIVIVSRGTEASSLRTSRIRGALGGSLRSTSRSPLRASVESAEDLRSLIFTTCAPRGA